MVGRGRDVSFCAQEVTSFDTAELLDSFILSYGGHLRLRDRPARREVVIQLPSS
jgi:hypothetical protein